MKIDEEEGGQGYGSVSKGRERGTQAVNGRGREKFFEWRMCNKRIQRGRKTQLLERERERKEENEGRERKKENKAKEKRKKREIVLERKD